MTTQVSYDLNKFATVFLEYETACEERNCDFLYHDYKRAKRDFFGSRAPMFANTLIWCDDKGEPVNRREEKLLKYAQGNYIEKITIKPASLDSKYEAKMISTYEMLQKDCAAFKVYKEKKAAFKALVLEAHAQLGLTHLAFASTYYANEKYKQWIKEITHP